MKKIFSFITLFVLFLGFANAEVVTKTVTKTSSGEGHGLTREEAINNAIVEAIGKMGGVNINSIKKSGVYAASSNKGTDILDTYSSEIRKATKGRADSYEIDEAYQDADGKWVARVTIKNSKTTKSYKAPGLKASSRRSISVLIAQCKNIDLWAKGLKST